jgi:hypothetical protein
MVKMFNRFRDDGVTPTELANAIDYEFLDGPTAGLINAITFKNELRYDRNNHDSKFHEDFFNLAFSNFKEVCTKVIPGQRNAYVQAVCNDFQANKWKDVFSLINGARNMPGSIDPYLKARRKMESPDEAIATDGSANASSNATLSRKLGYFTSDQSLPTFQRTLKPSYENSIVTALKDSIVVGENVRNHGCRYHGLSGRRYRRRH